MFLIQQLSCRATTGVGVRIVRIVKETCTLTYQKYKQVQKSTCKKYKKCTKYTPPSTYTFSVLFPFLIGNVTKKSTSKYMCKSPCTVLKVQYVLNNNPGIYENMIYLQKYFHKFISLYQVPVHFSICFDVTEPPANTFYKSLQCEDTLDFKSNSN